MQKIDLTTSQLRVMKCILESNSIGEAAKKAGVSRASIYNWLKDEHFAECLDMGRRELFEEGLNSLKGATAKAAETLIELLGCNDRNTRRLAAKEIISFAIKVVETKELEERVSQLEELLKQNKLK